MAGARLAGSKVVDKIIAVDAWCAPFVVDMRRVLAAAPRTGRRLLDALASTPELIARRRAASHDRLAKGIDAWNEWAFTLLKLRHDLRDEPVGPVLLDVLATADFSDQRFEQNTDLGAWQFPGDALFPRTRFRRDLWLADAKLHGRADFGGAEFEGKVWCEFARFAGFADFSGALFAKSAEFRDSRFLGGASFAGASFLDAWFRGAEWRGEVTFAEARFAGEVGLGASTWYGGADFSGAAFGDNAGFDKSTFAGRVTFAGARFGRNARFEDTRFAAKPAFERVRFAVPPTPADVLQAPKGSPVHDQIAEIRRRLGVG